MRLATPTVIAVGYSVRALAEACWQAGLNCIAVDHFGDADTRQYANDQWVELQLTQSGLLSGDTQRQLQSIATELRCENKRVICLLAGGMENLGGACTQLRSIAEVIGPAEAQRAALREIRFLQEIAAECHLQFPSIQQHCDCESDWLWKPFSSAGGLHISRDRSESKPLREGYWQQFIAGESIGVSCLVDHSQARILGATGAFTAHEWPGPLEFIYRGSYGPVALDPAHETNIELLCKCVHARTGYIGWLQFDFIRTQPDHNTESEMWLLECNPRWTAGMEVLLHSGGANPVSELLDQSHLPAPKLSTKTPQTPRSYAKAIVYATHSVFIDESTIVKLHHIAGLADLPYAPQWIEAGHPIATVRAGAPHDEAPHDESNLKSQLLAMLHQQARLVLATITA